MATTEQTPHTLVPPESFVRTYGHPSYADPWAAVEDYDRVTAYCAEHPSLGSSAVGSRLDLPRGRVREWMDGAKPDCLRGLEAARTHGWIDVEPASPVFRGLNALLAWVFSGGSVSSSTFAPYFVVRGDEDRDLVGAAAALAGIEVDFTRSATEGRAREVRPVQHASVLGRVLVVLGAPRGEKNERATVTLPAYLQHAPRRVREAFVQVYLHNRGQERPGSGNVVHFREDRTAGYLRSLAGLIRQLTGERVTVSEKNVILSGAAARATAVWDPLLQRL